MNRISRRAMALYASDQLLAGKSPAGLAKQLAVMLVESGRAGDVEFLLGDVAWELEQRQALVTAQVFSVNPLTKSLEAALKAQLKKATGSKEVLMETQIDKTLLGGLKVETSGRVWDLSVAHELAQLRESF